jgi:hypothetical protein
VVTALGEVAAAPLDAELERALRVEVEPALEAETSPELELLALRPAAECELAATAVAVRVLCASAGSWPVTSWTSTAPLAARNVASDMPATRRRMERTRRRRAASFALAAVLRPLWVGGRSSFMATTVTGRHRNPVTVREGKWKN